MTGVASRIRSMDHTTKAISAGACQALARHPRRPRHSVQAVRAARPRAGL